MSEYDLLERRVSALEQEVEGEKVVTRYIVDQTRRNGDDIAALRRPIGRIETRLDRVEGDVRAIRQDLRSLRADLPGMIADTMREVLRGRDR